MLVVLVPWFFATPARVQNPGRGNFSLTNLPFQAFSRVSGLSSAPDNTPGDNRINKRRIVEMVRLRMLGRCHHIQLPGCFRERMQIGYSLKSGLLPEIVIQIKLLSGI